MSTTGGDWRNGPAYDYFDILTPEQVAFEFLRRNKEYAAAYAAIARASMPDKDAEIAFAARWGLRFPDGSDAPSGSEPDRLAAPAQPASTGADDALCGIDRRNQADPGPAL